MRLQSSLDAVTIFSEQYGQQCIDICIVVRVLGSAGRSERYAENGV